MKRAVCTILLMIMCSLVSACTIGNVDIVFGEEAKSEPLFSLGEYGECTREEMIVYFFLVKAEYEEVFGENVWDMKIDSMSMEGFVKNNILTQALEEKSMSALARLKGLELTEEETSKIKTEAENVYDTLLKDTADETGITVKTVESVLTDARLSELAFEYITKDVDTEISDAEAKVITVKYVKYDLNGKDYTEAMELMEEIHELLKSSNFDTVSARYSEQIVSDTIDVCKGDMSEIVSEGESLEDKLFALSDNELSEVISVTGEAIYIFKSVEDYDADKTEANKSVILEKRKNDIMQKEYDAFIEEVEYYFDDVMWEELSFEEWL